MRRLLLWLLLFLAPATAGAQVQSIGDVSFAVPDGWTYKPGAGFGSMVLASGQSFWLMGVFNPMPSSGDSSTDLKTAWTAIVLSGKDYQGYPPLPYYAISHSVGYPGVRADGSNLSRTSYTRLYVLEAGKSFIPVMAMSREGMMLNSMEHVADFLIGSVRLAPLKAQPIKTTINVADLAGHWIHGMASSQTYYDQQSGRYVGNTSAFYGAGYDIAPNGSFTYKMSGMMNSGFVGDQDSGVVELGAGMVIFRGRNHEVRYQFINCQQALDGSTVLTLLPDKTQVNAMTILNQGDEWSRPPRK
jgi:hypothetical protein